MHSRSREGATRAGVVVTVAVALATLSACASAPAPSPSSAPSNDPAASPAPTLVDTGSAIQPGVVDRTSLDLTATYNVDAAITVRTGLLDVTTEIVVLNASGGGIDRVELNTIAARLGGLQLTTSTVDGEPVDVTVAD